MEKNTDKPEDTQQKPSLNLPICVVNYDSNECQENGSSNKSGSSSEDQSQGNEDAVVCYKRRPCTLWSQASSLDSLAEDALMRDDVAQFFTGLDNVNVPCVEYVHKAEAIIRGMKSCEKKKPGYFCGVRTKQLQPANRPIGWCCERAGKGSYGKVYKVTYRGKYDQQDKVLALKVIKGEGRSEKLDEPELLLKLSKNEQCKQYIPHWYGTLCSGNSIFIAMSYEALTLEQYLHKKQVLPHDKIVAISKSLLHAVHALEQAGINHGDIKPNNIMVNEEGEELKLIDFGTSSNFIKGEKFRFPGRTLCYCPPEVCREPCQVYKNSDIPSIALIILYLYRREHVWQKLLGSKGELLGPHPKKDDCHMLKVEFVQKMTRCKAFFVENYHLILDEVRSYRKQKIPASICDLLCSMLQSLPEKRYGAEEALKHLALAERGYETSELQMSQYYRTSINRPDESDEQDDVAAGPFNFYRRPRMETDIKQTERWSRQSGDKIKAAIKTNDAPTTCSQVSIATSNQLHGEISRTKVGGARGSPSEIIGHQSSGVVKHKHLGNNSNSTHPFTLGEISKQCRINSPQPNCETLFKNTSRQFSQQQTGLTVSKASFRSASLEQTCNQQADTATRHQVSLRMTSCGQNDHQQAKSIVEQNTSESAVKQMAIQQVDVSNITPIGQQCKKSEECEIPIFMDLLPSDEDDKEAMETSMPEEDGGSSDDEGYEASELQMSQNYTTLDENDEQDVVDARPHYYYRRPRMHTDIALSYGTSGYSTMPPSTLDEL